MQLAARSFQPLPYPNPVPGVWSQDMVRRGHEAVKDVSLGQDASGLTGVQGLTHSDFLRGQLV
jgi:hypothetical protein